MPLTDLGRRWTMDRLIGAAVAALDASGTWLSVGDTATAFSAAQTDLAAPTNKLRKAVTGAPSRSGDVITYSAQFTSGEANWAWAEGGGHTAVSAGTMIFRWVASLGTKASGVWTLTVTQTWASA